MQVYTLSKKLFAGLVLLTLLSSCADPEYIHLNMPYNSAANNQLTDDKHFTKKLQELVDANYSESASVRVISDYFDVLIVGEIKDVDTENHIATLIKSQQPIKKYFDYTVINEKPELLLDNSLNKKVQFRISQQLNITLIRLHSIVVNGVVYITGHIDENETDDLNTTISAIYTIPGVNKVVNLVQTMTVNQTN
jgi:osmotically-inducible protein OsmY